MESSVWGENPEQKKKGSCVMCAGLRTESCREEAVEGGKVTLLMLGGCRETDWNPKERMEDGRGEIQQYVAKGHGKINRERSSYMLQTTARSAKLPGEVLHMLTWKLGL